MGGQLKRRRPAHLLRPDQMMAKLASLRLHALLQHGGVWLALPPEGAELLNQCCTGQMDGGPGTAEEVAAVLAPLVGEPVLLPLPEPGSVPGPQLAANSVAAAAAAELPGQPPVPAAGTSTEALTGQPNGTEPNHATEGSTLAAGAPFQAQGRTAAQREEEQGPQQEQGQEPAGGSGRDAMQVDSGAEEVGAAAASGASALGAAAGIGLQARQTADAGEERLGTSAAVGSGNGGPEASSALAGGTEAARTAGGVGSSPAPVSSPPGAAPHGGPGRGRGRRGGGGRGAGPPYAPAANGCRLVAVRLTPEETFFLHHVLQCLQVWEVQPGAPMPATSDHVHPLDTQGLWRACLEIRSNFVTSYVAYHHLKAKGWIPRSGLLYGVDYVVYQLHPVGAHSDYGVLVMPLAPGGGPAGPHAPPLSWLDLQITNRLVNQVVKKLILLYLYERPGPDHSTPACLANFAVEERIVRRWVPDATRD